MSKQRKPKRKSGNKKLSKLEKVLLITATLNLITAMVTLANRIIDLIN